MFIPVPARAFKYVKQSVNSKVTKYCLQRQFIEYAEFMQGLPSAQRDQKIAIEHKERKYYILS